MTAGKFGATTGGFGGTTGSRHPFDNGHGPVLVVTVLVAYLPFELLSCCKRPRNGHDRRRRAGNRRAASRHLPGRLGPWTAGRRTTSVSAPARSPRRPARSGAVRGTPTHWSERASRTADQISEAVGSSLSSSPTPWRATLPQPVGVGLRGAAEPGLGGRAGPSVPKLRGGAVPVPGRTRPGVAGRAPGIACLAAWTTSPAAKSARLAGVDHPSRGRNPPVSRGDAPESRRGPKARCFPVPRCRSASWRTTAIDPLWQRRRPAPAGLKSSRRGAQQGPAPARSSDGRLARSNDLGCPPNDLGCASDDLGCALRGPSPRPAPAAALPPGATGRPQRGPSPVDRSERFARSFPTPLVLRGATALASERPAAPGTPTGAVDALAVGPCGRALPT